MDIDSIPKEKIALQLYQFVTESYQHSLSQIERTRLERLNLLKENLIKLTISECQDLMLSWEEDDLNRSVLDQNMGVNLSIIIDNNNYERIDFKVFNQFQNYWRNGDSRNSCLAISIIFSYQFSLAKTSKKDDYNYIDSDLLNEVMEKGITLYSLWYKHQKSYLFPTIQDILNMKKCDAFKKQLNIKDEIAGYCVIHDKEMELLEKSNTKLTFKLLFPYIFEIFKNSPHTECIISIINCNNNYSFTIGIEKNMIYLFDSHGYENSNYIDFIRCNDYQIIIEYILNKYSIEGIINEDDVKIKRSKENDFSFISKYTYTATIFY